MIIIVDGYNVLKQTLGNKLISSRERAQYITHLQHYSRKKKHTFIVVFDGGEHIMPSKEITGNVTVVYAGAQINADTWIINYIRTQNPSSLLLVSSDRTLVHQAQEYNVVSIGSYDFHTIVQESCAQPLPTSGALHNNPAIKLHPDETSAAEDLMRTVAETLRATPPKKDNANTIHVSLSSKKTKKQDKLLLKKLRAL